MNKISFWVFLLFILPACGSSAESDAASSIDKNKLKGHYIYGHEENSFQPCNQKKVFWVIGDNNILLLLEENYLRYTSTSYEEVYLEISGEYKAKAKDGFAMDYDGQIQVLKMLQMRKKMEQDCK